MNDLARTTPPPAGRILRSADVSPSPRVHASDRFGRANRGYHAEGAHDDDLDNDAAAGDRSGVGELLGRGRRCKRARKHEACSDPHRGGRDDSNTASGPGDQHARPHPLGWLILHLASGPSQNRTRCVRTSRRPWQQSNRFSLERSLKRYRMLPSRELATNRRPRGPWRIRDRGRPIHHHPDRRRSWPAGRRTRWSLTTPTWPGSPPGPVRPR
jgi:hypothetical protein